jgi:large repetitive protein
LHFLCTSWFVVLTVIRCLCGTAGTAYAFDRCNTAAPNIVVADVPSAVACSNQVVQTIRRTFTATDACGNPASATQTISIEDTLPPQFNSLPNDYTVQCSTQVTAPPAVTATDICTLTAAPTVTTPTVATGRIENQECANRYTNVMTYVVADSCGNRATHDLRATVYDNTPPVMTGGIIDGAYSEVVCAPSPAIPGLTTNDNCGGSVTVASNSEIVPVPGRVGYYDMHRLITATDVCGNVATVCNLSLSLSLSHNPYVDWLFTCCFVVAGS